MKFKLFKFKFHPNLTNASFELMDGLYGFTDFFAGNL